MSSFRITSLFLLFATLFSLSSALSLPPNVFSRQAPTLKTGSWIITYQPSAPNTPLYKGPLRITSNSSSTFISGDLYNGTVVPNPADGSPILPRANYHSFVRTTGLTPEANGGFSLNLEFIAYRGTQQRPRGNFTLWADTATDGGYTVNLSPATAPTGYPDASNYFAGVVKITSSGAAAGHFTMGWVSSSVRRITVEIGTVSGVEVPLSDTSGTRTWKSIFADVGYDIHLQVGKTDIPETTSHPLGPTFFNNEQQHQAVLANRLPTDFDTEWKYYLLVVRHNADTPRGAMIDTDSRYNLVPREGTCMSSDWVFGTAVDGRPDNEDNWPSSVVGQKFSAIHDAWFRTAVHEIGHMFNLDEPWDEPGFVDAIMSATTDYVKAGDEGVTEEKFPENITPKSFKFSESNRRLMQHRPDTHVRPGWLEFSAGNNQEPSPVPDLQG